MLPTTHISTTMTQMATQQGEQLEYAEPPREEELINTLNQVRASICYTIRRQPPGGDPDPPNPGGPGGGGGGPNLPNNAAHPLVVPIVDTRTVGALPQIFNRSREKANNFIKEVKDYLQLNEQVSSFNSPQYKIAFTLMLIKGLEVVRWKRDMERWLDNHV